MHPLKLLITTLFIVTRFIDSSACGNEYYRTDLPFYKGKLDIKNLLNWNDNATPYWTHGFGDGHTPAGYYELEEKLLDAGLTIENTVEIPWSKMQEALDKKIDFKLLSDLAWHELRMGSKESAVKLLEALYAKHPNEYNVLANLGTAYEVTGKNKEALDLLRKAVTINPQSHFGSEWIHIKILEQKIAATPDYRLIIDLKADADHTAWLAGKVYDKPIPPDSLMVQLAYQLHERIFFIAPPDPIVAQLVKDFADLVALTKSGKEAKAFYNYAVRYDSTVLTNANRIITPEKKEISVTKKSTGFAAYNNTWLLIIIAGLIAGIIIYTIVKKRSGGTARS